MPQSPRAAGRPDRTHACESYLRPPSFPWPVAGFSRHSKFVALIFEKSIFRPRQAEMLAQRRAVVVAPEQAAPLQFRHDALDKIVEPARQIGKHHGEAVGALGFEPFLHLV